jgi:hypothetical protein
MATVVTAKKRETKTYNTGTSGGSSGSSSTRTPIDYGSIGGTTYPSSTSSSSTPAQSNPTSNLPTGTYTQGDKYAGGNVFTRPDGTQYQTFDYFTSPSGKTTYTDQDGTITVTGSSNKDEIGKVYNTSGDYLGYTVPAAYGNLVNGQSYDNIYGLDANAMLQVNALQAAMAGNRDALEDSFYANKRALKQATLDGQRQAYINQQKALKALPQTMAAAGYNGGVTESTAANIANEYQNAWNDYERAEAQELARLQADLANGIANINTQYNVHIANALQQAQANKLAQDRWDDEMELKREAAAIAAREIALKEKQFDEENDENKKPSINAPVSLAVASRQAINSRSMAPIAAYYASMGLSSDQIAKELNWMVTDPESAYYGFNRG